MAKQIKVREDNYFAVQGWMVTELKLKGNALMLYAIIYGFSQTTNTAFTGSVDYLCEWLGGVSRPTVINTLDNLVKQGLLTKSSTTKGALIYNSYTALRPSKKILSDEDPTSKKTLPDTSKNFLLNKDSKNNIEKSISKEMEGKAPKKKSYSTILEDPVNKFVKEALSKFIQYCRGKNYTPKVTTVEKFASTLRDNAGEDPVVALAIVDQSIDKGWKDLYPLKNYGRQGKPTAVSLDKNSMKRISQVLQKAECIDIYGTGISYILAQSAAFKISTLGLECSAYESINSHYLAARKHKKNIAFLISLTGSNHTVICMAKYLREATETYVVGIAGPYHTELKKWCHEIVEIPNRDALLSLDVITSFSGATYILDIFFALLLSKRYEEHARSSMEMLNHLSLLWDETYHTKEKNE